MSHKAENINKEILKGIKKKFWNQKKNNWNGKISLNVGLKRERLHEWNWTEVNWDYPVWGPWREINRASEIDGNKRINISIMGNKEEKQRKKKESVKK